MPGNVHHPYYRNPTSPSSLSTIDPRDWTEAELRNLAARVLKRVRQNRHSQICGSWVLVDARGLVWVLSDGATTTARLVAEHSSFVVGHYAAGERFAFPAPRDLEGDVRAHLQELLR